VTQVFFESLHRSGIPFVARLLPSRHLLVLNFHRVRDEASPFHDGMIELNSKQFSEHMAWIARRADFVNEESLHTLKSGGRPKVMLTFDDGYSDAHEVVAPILEKAGIPASFFVAPGMLDQRKLGSWDRIAYLVKKCPVKKFQFRGRDFSLEDGIRSACLELGDWSQASLPDRGDEFVADLASTLGIAPPAGKSNPAKCSLGTKFAIFAVVASRSDVTGFRTGYFLPSAWKNRKKKFFAPVTALPKRKFPRVPSLIPSAAQKPTAGKHARPFCEPDSN
jgi:hypothetical protein